MVESLSFGFLAMSVTAPCAVGWMIGDFLGARRAALRLAPARDCLQRPAHDQARGHLHDRAPEAAAGEPGAREAKRGRVRIAQRADQRVGQRAGDRGRDLFLDMPSLPELASEIATIRADEPLWEPLWEQLTEHGSAELAMHGKPGNDADVRVILEHYRGAISELAALQPGREYALHAGRAEAARRRPAQSAPAPFNAYAADRLERARP